MLGNTRFRPESPNSGIVAAESEIPRVSWVDSPRRSWLYRLRHGGGDPGQGVRESSTRAPGRRSDRSIGAPFLLVLDRDLLFLPDQRFRFPGTSTGIAGESGMTRPQRGAHRFMEESVPRTLIEEGHPTSGDPVIPIARPFERPGSVRAGRWRDCLILRARMDSFRAFATTARDRD